MSSVRLTSLSHGAGCACKLSAKELASVLKDLPLVDDPRFATIEKRVNNREILIPLLETRFAQDTANNWVEKLDAHVRAHLAQLDDDVTQLALQLGCVDATVAAGEERKEQEQQRAQLSHSAADG